MFFLNAVKKPGAMASAFKVSTGVTYITGGRISYFTLEGYVGTFEKHEPSHHFFLT
jgi:hypothetical protein